MALIESVVFGCFVIICIKFYEIMQKHFEMKAVVESMNGPNELPLIGVALKSLKVNIFEYVMDLKDKFESPVKFWFGPTDLVVVVDKPNDIKAVLCSENALNKAPFYKFFNMGNGLFVSDKEVWKVHRKILSRSFNKNQLENSIPVINEKAHELVTNLRSKEGKVLDMFHEVINGVLETIFVNFFDLKCIASIKEKYVDNAEKMNRFAMERTTKAHYYIEPLYKLSNLRKEEIELENEIDKYFEDLIENEVLPARAQNIMNNNDQDRKQKKLIDFLLDPNNGFSNDDIRDHFKATVYGGYDTSTSTVAASLLMMAMHQDVQSKVYAEIKQWMEHDDPSCLEDVSKFVYLDMVVRETMRLFPVGAIIGRFSSGKVLLENHEIPTGALILINVMNVHRNPEHWGKDADRFVPERFANERFKKVHPFAYLPFTGGPRLCLAYKYGMLSVKLFLAHIIRSYEVSTTLKFDEIELDVPIILKIKQGYHMSLRRRGNLGA